ncbi:hypothetical protein [Bradyrhizobium sp. dw_78]|uniref:hypothetical protein n=1 Tax=Bradyrhizobium sp. dw_78 TaxID=2719793 RepID=UPI001BD52303|nr:hypothetical protein [Bradyrhizobium sp. dw_78]
MQDGCEADEDYKQFQKLSQAAIIGEPVDCPKTDRPNDDNNQDAYQDRNHHAPLYRPSPSSDGSPGIDGAKAPRE